ncbi:carbamoyl phosphate synthase preATP-grasp domain-containing protein [Jeotgalibacillus sp. ET6]
MREEGIHVVLVNNNPATIMTDNTTASGFRSAHLLLPINRFSFCKLF